MDGVNKRENGYVLLSSFALKPLHLFSSSFDGGLGSKQCSISLALCSLSLHQALPGAGDAGILVAPMEDGVPLWARGGVSRIPRVQRRGCRPTAREDAILTRRSVCGRGRRGGGGSVFVAAEERHGDCQYAAGFIVDLEKSVKVQKAKTIGGR